MFVCLSLSFSAVMRDNKIIILRKTMMMLEMMTNTFHDLCGLFLASISEADLKATVDTMKKRNLFYFLHHHRREESPEKTERSQNVLWNLIIKERERERE